MSRTLLSIALLTCVVLALFHRLLLAEISVVDDVVMIKGMLTTNHFNLRDIFIPGSGTGIYYRPMIGLSFWLEKLLWSLHPAMLHLDNILFHLVNVLLLYVVALRLLRNDAGEAGYAPLAAALLFGLHPLVTESVDWISGRTDLAALPFVLLATLCLLRYRETGSWRYLPAAALALLPGILAKETTLAFPLAAALIASARRETGPADEPRSYGPFLRRLAWGGAAALAFLGAVYLLRGLAFSANDSRIGKGLGLMLASPAATLASMVTALGFYLKKFLLPLPLNFAITAISPWYLAAGIGFVLFCLWCAWRRDMAAALFLAGVCMLLPALLVINGTVTWTPYAERYCYPALPFWSLATVLWVTRLAPRLRIPPGALSAVALLAVAALGWLTWERNATWLTNEALLADTVNRSPLYVKVREFYMVALAMQGNTGEADRQAAIARSMLNPNFEQASDLALAEDLVQRGLQQTAFSFVEKKVPAGPIGGLDRNEVLRSFYRQLYQRTHDARVQARLAAFEGTR